MNNKMNNIKVLESAETIELTFHFKNDISKDMKCNCDMICHILLRPC